MKQKDSDRNNIICFSKEIEQKHVENKMKKMKSTTRVIAVTSGKGGVGKTNIVANLGFSFIRTGKKVLILDADLGLGNIDVLLGL